MTISQLAGARYLNPIRLARAQNGAGADGQWASDLAAYNRWIAEYGCGAVQQEQSPVAPPTPIFGFTVPGHDHSGGLMGKPLKHTVWHSMFGYIAQSSGDYEHAPLVTSVAATVFQLAEDTVCGVWIPGGRVYENLDFEVRLHFVSLGGGSGVSYVVKIRPIVGGPEYSASGTLSTGNNDITIADVAFRPGRLQSFTYSIQATTTNATCYLISAALHQTSDTP